MLTKKRLFRSTENNYSEKNSFRVLKSLNTKLIQAAVVFVRAFMCYVCLSVCVKTCELNSRNFIILAENYLISVTVMDASQM